MGRPIKHLQVVREKQCQIALNAAIQEATENLPLRLEYQRYLSTFLTRIPGLRDRESHLAQIFPFEGLPRLITTPPLESKFQVTPEIHWICRRVKAYREYVWGFEVRACNPDGYHVKQFELFIPVAITQRFILSRLMACIQAAEVWEYPYPVHRLLEIARAKVSELLGLIDAARTAAQELTCPRLSRVLEPKEVPDDRTYLMSFNGEIQAIVGPEPHAGWPGYTNLEQAVKAGRGLPLGYRKLPVTTFGEERITVRKKK